MGTVRFLLAMAVAVFHLALIPKIGHMAVQAFFVLSGYLMTLVMHSSYDYSPVGFGRFWLNRILRLYPMYLLVLVLMIGLIVIIGEPTVRRFDEFVYLPSTAGDWLQNVTFIYVNWFPSWEAPRLLPPSWALTMEMFYYFLISLGLSRWKSITWIWFALSLGWFAWVIATDQSFLYGYYHIASASLPFSMGALFWHYHQEVKQWLMRFGASLNRTSFVFIGIGFLGLLFASVVRTAITYFEFGERYENIVMLAHTATALVMVIGCVYLKLEGTAKRWDKLLGDLSYPIYIAHFFFALSEVNHFYFSTYQVNV